MAMTAEDLVSLDDMRLELSEPPVSKNPQITAALKGAVSWITERTSRPLLDVTDTVYCRRPYGPLGVLYVRRWDVTSVGDIVYWEPTQMFREDPTGVILSGDLGRKVFGDPDRIGVPHIYPPVDGWPKILAHSTFKVSVNRTWEVPDGVKTAIRLAARQLFEGYEEIRMDHPMYVFLEPYIRSVPEAF